MTNQIQVLSVASNKEDRDELSEILSGISDLALCAQASTTAEALLELEGESIDVAVITLGYSDAERIELIRQMRKTHSTVKVVIVTASAMPEDIFSALDAGADGYLLRDNRKKVLETAIRSVRLSAVWLDPDIAKQVLEVIQNAIMTKDSRILPTGLMTIPLMPEEKSLLTDVAGSHCTDGVCMVDPEFVKRLRRFAPHHQ